MSEYRINPSNKYIPPKSEFIWRDLKLDSLSSDIYVIVLGFNVWTGKYSDLSTMTNSSVSTIQRKINEMVENKIMTRSTIKITGETTRTILVCNYTKEGIRSDYEITALLHVGVENLDKYYSQRSINVAAKRRSRVKVRKELNKVDIAENNDIEITEELYRHIDF